MALKANKTNCNPSMASAKSAFKRYRDGDLTFEKWYELSQTNCYYCDAPPSQTINIYTHKTDHKRSDYVIKNGNFVYNGLDRVDNSDGHNEDNCVPCCKNCNWAKAEMSIKEFKHWIKKVYKHFCQQ
jgi:hypothetical protein